MKQYNLTEERYQRQIALPEVGTEGQERLAQSCIAVVGAGGLGSAILPILVGAGIGSIILIDDDSVSLSNLPRQTLYRESDLGRSKAEMAAQALRARNSATEILAIGQRLDASNATELLARADLIIDASDNRQTRLVLDHTARLLGKTWLHASLEGWQGQLALFGGPHAEHGHYAELFADGAEQSPELFPSSIPVMASTPAIVGSLAASAALQYCLGLESRLSRRLLLLDSLSLQLTLLDR